MNRGMKWKACLSICVVASLLAGSALAVGTHTPTKTKTPTFTPSGGRITSTRTPTKTHTPTATPTPGTQGCTHGFWKVEQHFDGWPSPFEPTTLLSDVFALGPFTNLNGDNVLDDSLLDSLNYGGGPNATGAARNLLKQAVAALLNAASGIYPLTTAQVIGMVNSALATEDRAIMLTLAESLDRLNNLGCPFD
jgi:hypothetical protein